MNQSALRAFLEKLSLGNYTSQEYKVFTDWVENANRDEYDMLLQLWQEIVEQQEIFEPVHLNLIQNIEARLDQVDLKNDNVKQLPVSEAKSQNIWKRIAVAASIILVLGVGGYFLSNSQQSHPQVAKAPQRNDIAPGKNRATLTLANGKKIILSDAVKGDLVEEAGARITKTANGQVVYTVVGTDSAKPNQFNTLSTANGETYKINLPDGTEVWLNAASSLTYPTVFTGKTREVALKGEGYFEVAKNKEKPFIVTANGAQIKVLGTHFNVSAYLDDQAVTATLVEGSIQMKNSYTSALIKPGQQGIATPQKDDLSVQPADTEQAIAWVNGNFSFNDATIKEVMKLASRWYNVQVYYTDSHIETKKLRGTVSRYKNITELLDNITLTSAIHYKLEGRKVILSK
jgi:transmembrane sensor